MAIEQQGACWYMKITGGQDYQNLIHYATQAVAAGDAKAYEGDDPEGPAEVGQWPGPCWVAKCDGDCGKEYEDDDMGWTVHWPTRAEAEDELRQADWHLLQDGRTFCFDDEPEDGETPVVAAVIPGQTPLFG